MISDGITKLKEANEILGDLERRLGGDALSDPSDIRSVAVVLREVVAPADKDAADFFLIALFTEVLVSIANGAPDASSLATAALEVYVDEDLSISDILNSVRNPVTP